MCRRSIGLSVLVVSSMATFSHAQFDTIINVPPDSAPESITSNTQLNVFDGGEIGPDFRAGDEGVENENVEVNITGGTVRDRVARRSLTAFPGAHVNISGGIVGRGIEAFSHSEVNISGGTVGTSILDLCYGLCDDFGIRAYSGSHITISGGTVRDTLYVEEAANVTLSGGTVGDTFVGFEGSQVRIVGGEFRLNGVLVKGLAEVGDSRRFDPEGSLFTGILADGSPFAFAGHPYESSVGFFGNDGFRGTLTLELSELPPIGPPIIVASTDRVPHGIREGQTLLVGAGGAVGHNFGATWGSTVRINDGAAVGDNFEAVGAEIIITGGQVGDSFDAFGGSRVAISGGTVGSHFDIAGSKLDVFGTRFRLDGSEINGTALGKPITIRDRHGQLSGTLADGSSFAFDLGALKVIADLFSANAKVTVTPVSLLPGDYNSDGLVEQSDLDLVLSHWGEELFNPFGVGWINDIPASIVDQAELDRVLSQWGSTAAARASAAGVPEPATSLLAFAALFVAWFLRAARMQFGPPRFGFTCGPDQQQAAH